MAGKPELSAAPVVVYVSNDNFAQAYAVGQQNVPQNSHPPLPNGGFPNTPHSMATVVGPAKPYAEKQILKPPDYPAGGQQQAGGGYFAGVLTQNGFPQPIVNDINYQNGAVLKNFTDVVSGDRQSGPGRPDLKVRDECDNRDNYVDSSYVTVMGAEVPQQSVRCDSVRSETAESSCSSLSSADESLVVVQNPPPSDMVVYDSSVSVRPGGVVLAVAPVPPQTQNHPAVVGTLNQQQQPSVAVPYGWKRLVNNGTVYYISPSNTALTLPEQVKEYLLTSGTCKCGLECHFKFDSVFNFDPKVTGKPWVYSPDTSQGDLTKLCNHKRKMLEISSLDCKPPDPNIKIRKEFNVKKKRGKIGLPYAGGVSVSQILAQREKLALNQQQQQTNNFAKDPMGNPTQQVWSQNTVTSNQMPSNRLPAYPDNSQQQFIRCQDQSGNRVLAGSPMIMGDGSVMVHQSSNQNISHQQNQQNAPMPIVNSNSNIHIHHQQIIGPNGQIISVQGAINPQNHNQTVVNQIPNSNGVVIQGQNVMQTQQQPNQHRIFINGQPNEPSGPGRPNVQMIPVTIANQQRQDMQRLQQHQFYNQNHQFTQQQTQQHQQYDPSKNIRPFNQMVNGFRPQGMPNNQIVSGPVQLSPQPKVPWQNRVQQQQPNQQNQITIPQQSPNNNPPNVYERVPPLHQHQPPQTVWQEEIKRKKVKLGKISKSRPYIIEGCATNHGPCPNIDVRQIPSENNRAVISNQIQGSQSTSSSPSFMEDPSGYLAQQTALLNHTINRQTGNPCGMVCNSPISTMPTSQQNPVSQANEIPLPSNMVAPPHMKNQTQQVVVNRCPQNISMINKQPVNHIMINQQQYNQMMQQNVADSSAVHEQFSQCQGCIADSMQSNRYLIKDNQQGGNKMQVHSRPNSEPGTPSSSGTSEDPVTSSTYSDKHPSEQSPDSRPIQGGTVSTSNVSPIDGTQSDPPTPNPHTPTPPQRNPDTSQMPNNSMFIYSQNNLQQMQQQSREASSSVNYIPSAISKTNEMCSHSHNTSSVNRIPGVVTAMASGRTVGSNTITSVLAGRANTATVSINTPPTLTGSSTPSSITGINSQPQSITVNVSKSPLEMVQSVVSSIQVPPHSQHHVMSSAGQSNNQMSPPQIIKHSPPGLPPGHILVSSGGQLIMASTGTGNGVNGVMAPPPPKLMANQGGMPPISVSPMVTNVTAAVTQVIPAVAQQVLGQQTVLVNALPAPSFVLQPGVTMTMDGMTVGQNMQIPQLLAGNVIQQQIQIDNSDARRAGNALLSPEAKKKGKKRKMSSQTVASMLHIAAQQNSGMMMSQQGFPQQIQMAHSPQGLTAGPVMQALTIVPSKTGGPPQIVMNGQANIGTQQLITNSQPTQQINLLQPVNLINGATGVVQNFPIQQFIVPNLGGSMVMNADGTATILQDTSNLGMQLQIQNVNGQNVLTPVQNNGLFNGGQNILAAGPAGMVIRAPSSQGKIIQQQQHSPGAQFLSPNGGQFVVNGAQFSGQLSPLVASVSPSQQMTFSTSPQAMRTGNSVQPQQQEYIQCNQIGQTLMVPCAPAPNIAVSSSNQQNTTYVQQNTTIVQQQTTMVSNNQQLQNFQSNPPQPQQNQPNVARTTTLNLDQNFIISSNDNKQLQAVVLQRESPQNPNYRQSVSTQTAVNQNAQSVTTNTFCQTSTISAGSPPDTTTLSPLASGGQSPPTADTTTHSGSTDDGLSPAPSNCSATCSEINVQQGRHQSCSMAMVHCISSSEPDSAEMANQNLEHEWRRNQPLSSTPKPEFTDISSGNGGQMSFGKKSNPTHVAYAESSTLMGGGNLHFITDQMKSQEAVVSSRNYEKMLKRKSSDAMVVMETRHMHSSMFEDDEENGTPKSPSHFVVGNLVWGPTKGCPAWPGKIVQVDGEKVSVRWFGGDKYVSKVDVGCLQTLTEGLDAHHQARKKCRTSRKLNSQLENAIQEAMSELDKEAEHLQQDEKQRSPQKVATPGAKKTSGRLRSSQR